MILGETISHYRVLQLLGAGGMGEVYKAEDTKLKRSVALKFLPLSLVLDRDAKERLVHEAQAASALDHPNICTIHEIDETPDGRVFLAMAYYEGETLKQRIARGPLAVDDALSIAAQIARAVTAAHEAGIIHRDIKPANIIITPRGEVKLLDFGIAKLTGQTALTKTGTTVGTVAYMSPEQITGRGVDERSDIWSIGVVLYEMLAGRPPFTGEHEVAVLRAIADTQPASLQSLRPETPAGLQAIVDKALQKEAKDRYAGAQEFLRDLEALRAPTIPLTAGPTAIAAPARPTSRRRLLIVSAALLALTIGSWFVYRQEQIRSARQTLRQVTALVEKQQFANAFVLLRHVEPRLGSDPEFVKVRDSFLLQGSVRTEPSGADVYAKPYADVNGKWEYLGQSPLQTHVPIVYFRWRVTKPGFVPLEGAYGSLVATFTLVPDGSLPDGMVAVTGGPVSVRGAGTIRLADFFIDRFEVTNREFKRFVDAGGYRKPEFWTEPFVKDGRSLSWDQAMAEFRDATGRPGPSTWELGTYADGQDEYPVHGVSWYEAAAYARFAGRTLPTVYHWQSAAGLTGPPSVFSDILELSNFLSKTPARVGEFKGLGPYGTYDMAGNVKEWCWNAVGDRRYILGGGWNEPNYQFRGEDARLPFDRSSNNGFRTIKLPDPASLPASALQPVERLTRDFSQDKPASDDVYRIYAGLYAYDRTDLKASVDSVDDSAPAWRLEKITYAAPYGTERIAAYLFLPKHATPPYQTVVYFPHSGGLTLSSFEKGELSYLGFVVKAGRALLFPMYKGMYERRLVPTPSGPNASRDLTIDELKDLRRSVDYLETRPDIDRERLAYFGVSFGARLGPIALALEKRFKAAVLWSGGFQMGRSLPEVDEVNYAPRVTTPVLMLNGRDDFTFPIESSQVPMFQMLGTPDKDKRRILYDGGHIFPFARVEKDTLDWFDRYLGVPK